MTDQTKLSLDLIQEAILNPDLPLSCADLHAGSCNHKASIQFINSARSLSKPYLIVHLIPLFLRTKELKSKYRFFLLETCKSSVPISDRISEIYFVGRTELRADSETRLPLYSVVRLSWG